MATITTLNSGDTGSTSRGVINTNFTNLNSDKAETSALSAYLNKSTDDLDDINAGTTNKHFTATLESKLNGIEAGADVTDAANVAAAGAVMNTGNETIAGIKTFSSSPIVPAPTTDLQAATKKYVDDNIGTGTPEGTAIKSTGETGGSKFLREDGDGTCSWQAISGGGDALTSNPLSQFAATTSLQLKGIISDETGSGALVFANSPALITPTGIVKGDVGLGNVDNTSDATKNSAVATLTNKTLTSPKINEDVAVTATATEINVLDGIPATLTATELGYVDGVTSAIQTQLNAKAPTASPTFTGTVTLPTSLTGAIRVDSGVVSVDANIPSVAPGTAGNVLASTGSAWGSFALPTSNDTTKGLIEIATSSETTTGTDATRAVTPDGLAGSTIFGQKTVQIMVFEQATDWATGDGKAYFVVPEALNGMNLIRVHARAITAGTTGTSDIQLRNVTDSVDCLSTKLTIDSGETGSDTAATAAVIDTTKDDLATNDLIAVDIDATSTTKPKGLILTLECRLP